MPDDKAVTVLLHAAAAGDGSALDLLVPLLYHELQRLARGYMRNERRDHTLSVPLSAVLARGGSQAVLVPYGRRIEERKVVLGPSNEHLVVVEEGLREGERVLVNPPPADRA